MLGDYVFDYSRNRRGFRSIDAAPGQTKEAITGRLLELGGKGLGQFDDLVLDSQTTNGGIICANVARRSGGVAVLDLPGAARNLLESARFAWAKGIVASTARGLSGLIELNGPDLMKLQALVHHSCRSIGK